MKGIIRKVQAQDTFGSALIGIPPEPRTDNIPDSLFSKGIVPIRSGNVLHQHGADVSSIIAVVVSVQEGLKKRLGDHCSNHFIRTRIFPCLHQDRALYAIRFGNMPQNLLRIFKKNLGKTIKFGDAVRNISGVIPDNCIEQVQPDLPAREGFL